MKRRQRQRLAKQMAAKRRANMKRFFRSKTSLVKVDGKTRRFGHFRYGPVFRIRLRSRLRMSGVKPKVSERLTAQAREYLLRFGFPGKN